MAFTQAISPQRTAFRTNYWLWLFLLLFFSVWINTFLGTSNVSNFFLENIVTFLSLFFLSFTFKRFQFSDLSYLLITLYLCLHMYGSKYTYTGNPLGYWLKDQFSLSRNHYDRMVHFSFGFLLAYPMRELFLKWFRYSKVVSWLLPIEITISLSTFYELYEWVVADILFPEQYHSFLGSQGDVWDAQKDVSLALLGVVLATCLAILIKRLFKIYEQE